MKGAVPRDGRVVGACVWFALRCARARARRARAAGQLLYIRAGRLSDPPASGQRPILAY